MILGAGLVGCELAVYLALRGHAVEIVEMGDRINAAGNMVQGMVVAGELKRHGVKLHFRTKAVAITEEGVNCAGLTVKYLLMLKPLFMRRDRSR